MERELPMFPLEVTLLPDDDLPLRIFEPRYTQLVSDCLATAESLRASGSSAAAPVFGVVLIAAGREVGGGDNRYDVGALARIVEHHALGNGLYRLRCRVSDRIRVLRWLADDPYPRALVQDWPDEPGEPVSDESIRELEDRVMALFERLAAARGAELPPRDMLFAGVAMAEEPGDKLYALASRVAMGQADRYTVLAAPSPDARLRALAEAVDMMAAMVDFQLPGE